MSGQMRDTQSVSAALADRLRAPVDSRDRERAALLALDWAGCAVAVRNAPAAKAMATVFPYNDVSADWQNAVMWLGALGNILEMDDVDKRALLHPGPVVTPSALVAAARCSATDGVFLNAIVRGYEAMIRIGRSVGPGHYRYWHNTSTCGPFGAAAAATSIAGLDKDQTSEALGLAATQAAGLWQVRAEPMSHGKQLHTARAAQSGLSAAFLAEAGFVGIKTALEGEQGFFAAMCPGVEATSVDTDPGRWAIHEVSIKPWPACRHAHAAIDAALLLRKEITSPDQLEEIEVKTFRDALVFCDDPDPEDSLSAKFSLQHAVAVTLLFGPPQLEHFEQVVINNETIASLRKRIKVSDDPRFSKSYPAHFGAEIGARAADQTVLTYCVLDALGDPENPISKAQVLDKFRTLCAWGDVSMDAVDRLTKAISGDFGGRDVQDALKNLVIGSV
ncbi:MAG: MmgE/PrpD family protein [Pseudomonadota bacterium]